MNVEFVFEYVTMTTTVTNKDIINGAAGFVLYQTTYYDRYLDFSNFTFDLKATHVHSYETVSSDSKIAAVKSICSGCGEVQSVTVPTLDFTQNTYGACAYNHTASSDYPTQLMVIEANKLSYKSYELDKVFSFTMPKIDFRDFATVSITVSSTGWYERMSFGFTQEQAATMANHTTYGGSKTGTLSFAWSGDTLNVTFKFEYVTLTSTVTDSNIISGANGFSLFVTSGYDRYLDFSNFALTLKA